MKHMNRGPSDPHHPVRRKMLTVGVPAVLAVSALVSVPFLIGAGDDSVRSIDAASTDTTSTTTTIPGNGASTDAVFSEAATAQSTLPGGPATSTSTTTTLVPATVAETLPAQPSDPIAPPADPRGFEEQIQLGGISIPKLGLDAPLLEGIRLTTLDNGPGHWPGTAMPGQVGNVVVAAHRTSHGAPFRDIDQLVPGDVVTFSTADGESEYTVTGTEIVEPDAIWIVDPTDTPTATLFACHPPGSVAQRIVVHLELAP
jgi:sortase A